MKLDPEGLSYGPEGGTADYGDDEDESTGGSAETTDDETDTQVAAGWGKPLDQVYPGVGRALNQRRIHEESLPPNPNAHPPAAKTNPAKTPPANTPPGKTPKEGIYQFPDAKAGNKPYTGQSQDIPGRLKTHKAKGRLSKEAETKTKEVPGGKTAREIEEHKAIQELTGGAPASKSPNVSNQRDPIGPNRRDLLD